MYIVRDLPTLDALMICSPETIIVWVRATKSLTFVRERTQFMGANAAGKACDRNIFGYNCLSEVDYNVQCS